MKPLWVFVDLDGTLRDQYNQPRPFIMTLFDGIHAIGGKIIVWSGGGAEYASEGIARLGFLEVVDGVTGKGATIQLEGRYFYIDDQEEVLNAGRRGGHGVYHLPFFHADRMPHDVHLLRALQEIRTYAEVA